MMKLAFRHGAALLCGLQLICAGFLLRLQNGRVCWYDGAQARWFETSVCADALSSADRALLSGGLTFDTRAQLTRALEDFCS